MMAKLLLSLALLSFLIGIAVANDHFKIQGRVYCDTCRAGFETSATEYIPGAKVKVECRNYTTNELLQQVEGKTDSSGKYNIKIKDTHDEDQVCEVILVDSGRKDCSEVSSGRDRAPILLASDSGISSTDRQANSLGFLRSEPLAKCGALLQQYALSDELD